MHMQNNIIVLQKTWRWAFQWQFCTLSSLGGAVQGVSWEILYFPSEQVLPCQERSKTPVSGLQLSFTATVQSSKGLPELWWWQGESTVLLKPREPLLLGISTYTPSRDRQVGEPCSDPGGLLESSSLETRWAMALSTLGLGDALGRQTCAEVTVRAQQHLCRTNLGEQPVSRLQTPPFISLLSEQTISVSHHSNRFMYSLGSCMERRTMTLFHLWEGTAGEN